MRLEGKRIIVTGGASGIAAATVAAYVKEGAIVASLDINDELGRVVTDAAAMLGPGSATYHHCDVTHQREVNRVFAAAVERMGGLDVLASIAGNESMKPAEDLTDADLDPIFAVHVKGTVFTNAAAFQAMRETGGSIINYASGAGVTGYSGCAAYSAAKGAILAYTRTAALEWGQHRISVNAVCPAAWTAMTRQHFDAMPADVRAEYEALLASRIPLGGTPTAVEDVAAVNVFLASDDSRFMTGQTIGVDGGWTMPR